MTYLFRKFRRELLNMKFRGILVILSIGLSIGMYGGLRLVKDNAFASRDNVLKETNYEDGRLVLYNMVSEAMITNLLQQVDGIEMLDVRLSIDITVSIEGKIFPSVIHNVHHASRPKINDFIMKKGDYSSLGLGQIIVEKRFADANHLRVGDPIKLIYGELEYVTRVGGIAFAPEHMYSVNPVTSLPEKGIFAPVWFSIDHLLNLLNMPAVINEILFKVMNEDELDFVLNKMITILQNNDISSLGIKGKEELDYGIMTEDVGTLDKFAIAIGMVILLVAVFIIYDSILKIITSQKTIIGILRALGASTSALLIHYISFGLVLTICGILIGLPIGYLITLLSTSIFVEAIGFELTTNIFRLDSFIPPILLAISISFLASLIGTVKIVVIRPVEAIDDQKIKNFDKRYMIENFFDKISTNKYSTRIPVRQVFRRKKRSFMTALTIAIAALIILTSFGFLDSFFHQMDGFYEKNNVADMEMSLIDPIPMQNITDQIDEIDGIKYYEGMVRQAAYVYGKNHNESSVIYAYSLSTKIRHYNFKEGELSAGEVAIGQILARKLGIGVGDQVEILTRGLTVFDTIQRAYRVSGITEEFFDNFVFIDLNTLQQDFGYGDSVNTIALQVSENSDLVKNKLYMTDLQITNVISLEQSKTSFESLMEAVIGFAYFVIVLGIIVLILFSLNVIVLDIMDREREFINIKVNGGSNFVIAKIISLQVVLISILVVVLDFFISPGFTQFIIDQTMRNLAYMEFYMEPISYGFSLISFIVGISVGLASAIHNVTAANIVESIRLRFRN